MHVLHVGILRTALSDRLAAIGLWSFGVISPVISVVISAFMIGLASGSWIAGKIIVSLTEKTKLPAIAFTALLNS